MSMCTIGMAPEFADYGVAANSLWQRTIIGTAAIRNLFDSDAVMHASRVPEILADAAYAILCRPAKETAEDSYIDHEVLEEGGITDLSSCVASVESELQTDIFLDS